MRCRDHEALHLAVTVTKWRYRPIYQEYTGGVTAIARDVFTRLNGFSNSFYGWGGEDDDLNRRLRRHNVTVARYPANIGR